MGLIAKPPSFAYCSTNVTGTPSATTGTGVAKSTTANVNGSVVALFTNLAHDVEYLVLSFAQFASTNIDNSGHVDLLVDLAGGSSWDTTNIWIEDLLVGGTMAITAGAQNVPLVLCFPIWLPAGASIGARYRGNNTSAITGYIQAYAYGGNKNPASWWCGQKVIAIGTTAASSSGTAHTAGNTGAFSSWASLGSTTPCDAGAVQFIAACSLSSHNTLLYRYEFGWNSTREFPPLLANSTTGEQMWNGAIGPLFREIPSGTQLQVRGTCSGTGQSMDVAAYLVV